MRISAEKSWLCLTMEECQVTRHKAEQTNLSDTLSCPAESPSQREGAELSPIFSFWIFTVNQFSPPCSFRCLNLSEVIREVWTGALSYFDTEMLEQQLKKCKGAALLRWCQATPPGVKHTTWFDLITELLQQILSSVRWKSIQRFNHLQITSPNIVPCFSGPVHTILIWKR